MFYRAQKEQQWGILKLKKLTETKHQLEAKQQKNCVFCENSLLQKNFRDAAKDHCHITGRYCGAAHNNCNVKLYINPKKNPHTYCISQSKGLRREPFNARDVATQ